MTCATNFANAYLADMFYTEYFLTNWEGCSLKHRSTQELSTHIVITAYSAQFQFFTWVEG